MYLTKMTVKELRTLAKDMGLKGQSALKKEFIIENLSRQIDMDHAAALRDNEAMQADDWQREHDASVDAYDQEWQIKDFWLRRGLHLLPVITADDVLAAIQKDHEAAIANDKWLTLFNKTERIADGYKRQNNNSRLTPAQSRRFVKRMRRMEVQARKSLV